MLMTLNGLCALPEDSCCNQRPLCTRTDFPWPIHTSVSTAVRAGEREIEIIKNKIKLIKTTFLTLYIHVIIHSCFFLNCNSMVYLPHLVSYLLSFVIRHHVTLTLSTLLSICFWCLSFVMSSKIKNCVT